MKSMKTAVVGILVLLLATAGVAKDKKNKPEEPSAILRFLIMKDTNGKPVRNAAVVMHPVDSHDRQKRGGLELKTDAEGKASFDGIPYGKLRVQVLAPGFQTFGDDYDVSQPTVDITIRLKPPAGQYSIYEDHPGEKKTDPKQ